MVKDGLSAPAARRRAALLQGKGLDQVIRDLNANRPGAKRGFALFLRPTGPRHGHRYRKSPRSAAATRGRGRYRRPQAHRPGGEGDLRGVAGLGAVPALVRLAAALHVRRRHPQRHRGACPAPGAGAVPGLHWPGRPSTARREIACRRSTVVLAARRRLRRRLPAAVLQPARDAAGPADDDGHRGRQRRPGAAAGGHAPRGRLADGRAGRPLHRVRDARPLHARRAVAQGCVAEPAAVAPVAHHRGRVRHRARRLGRHDLRLRALRHPARPCRRRQLHDAGQLRGAGPPARRAGQGGGGVVGAQRHDQRQFGEQRRQRRHLHDPADEEGRLRRHQGRRHRDHELGQRPDHAAGDGRGGLPDGGVRGHPLQRDREERDPAGHFELYRPAVYRAPRGAED